MSKVIAWGVLASPLVYTAYTSGLRMMGTAALMLAAIGLYVWAAWEVNRD